MTSVAVSWLFKSSSDQPAASKMRAFSTKLESNT
jgi:hypothetical protein